MSEPLQQTLTGQIIGNYRIIRSLGEGGMGTVYLGEHPEIRSKVAIKVLLPKFVADPEVVRRFMDEARAVNTIGHPGIVRIHDCDKRADIGVYLVMEYLQGKTLQEICEAGARFSPQGAAQVLQQAASALSASHEAGIIHRDLKPPNVFVVPDPDMPAEVRVKVLDFGIAKLLADQDSLDTQTRTGAVFGTPLYMSPEQCLDTKNVDVRSDIFSLGVIGYELLSQRLPYQADTLGKLVLKHQNELPEPLESMDLDAPPKLAQTIARALLRDPDARFQTMAEFRAALKEAVSGLEFDSLAEMATPEPVDEPDPGAFSVAEGTDGLSMEDTAVPPEAAAGEQAGMEDTVAANGAGTRPGLGSAGPVVASDAATDKTSPADDQRGGLLSTTMSASAGESTELAQRARRFRVLATVAALLLLGAGAAYIGLARAPDRGAASSETTVAAGEQHHAQRKPAAPVAPVQAPVAATVSIRLELTPQHATVLLDGAPAANNPLTLPMSDTRHTIKVEAEGHVAEARVIVANSSQTLIVALRPALAAANDEKKPRRRRKRRRPATAAATEPKPAPAKQHKPAKPATTKKPTPAPPPKKGGKGDPMIFNEL